MSIKNNTNIPKTRTYSMSISFLREKLTLAQRIKHQKHYQQKRALNQKEPSMKYQSGVIKIGHWQEISKTFNIEDVKQFAQVSEDKYDEIFFLY